MKTILEQVSLWGAIIGASLLAMNVAISGWAYIPFLFSNIAGVYLLNQSNASKVLKWQMLFFIVINVVGIARWLL